MNNPAIDGAVVNGESPFLHQFFNIPLLREYARRYNVVLDREWLQDNLGVALRASEVKGLQEMDKPKNMSKLALLGTSAALVQIQSDHFPATFDVS
jgi:hypothetical protein